MFYHASLVLLIPIYYSRRTDKLSRGDNHVKSVWPPEEEFTPSGSKLFPYKVDYVSEGAWCAEKQTGATKVTKLTDKIYQMYLDPLRLFLNLTLFSSEESSGNRLSTSCTLILPTNI